MKKTIILLLTFTVLLSSFILATVSNDEYVFYHTMDNDNMSQSIIGDSSGNKRPGVNVSASSATGYFNEGLDTSGGHGYNSNYDLDNYNSFTYFFRWKQYATGSYMYVLGNKGSGTFGLWFGTQHDSGNVFMSLNSGDDFLSYSFGTGQWVNTLIEYNGTHLNLTCNETYLWGEEYNRATYTGAEAKNWFGQFWNGGNVFNGVVDEVLLVNRTLTQTEKSSLWSATENPFAVTPTFSMTAKDNYNDTSINVFNVTLKNSSYVNHYSTTNGTINTPFSAGNFNITFNSTFYLSKLYNNYDVSSNLQASLIPKLRISNYNLTSDGGCIAWNTSTTTNCNTTDGTPTVTLTTNINANLSVVASTSSTDSYSYNSSVACSSTGGTSHVCTVYSFDKLAYGQNYIFIDGLENLNNTVSSDPLYTNMTAGTAGAGGQELISCISVVGPGCGVSFSNDCAVITQ